MKKIVKQINDFIRKENTTGLFFILLWVGFLVYANYGMGWYKSWVRQTDGLISVAAHSAIYFIAYMICLLITSLFNKNFNWLAKPWFWTISISAPLVFAFTSHYDFIDLLDVSSSNYNWLYYTSRVSFWFSQVAVVTLFCGVIWFFKDKGSTTFYGLSKYEDSLKPYFYMLLIMLVPIMIAGTTEGFLETYPRIKSTMKEGYPMLSKFHYISYEVIYGFNFIGIEIFFRGFLILSLLDILGKDAILPMACFYVAIHFGKPMGECISSFFGGSMLGIISYHNGSIKGGVLVHIGIAWMMEISGTLGTWFW